MWTALPCAAVLTLIAGIHFYWALGGRAGLRIAVPQTTQGRSVFKPRRGSTHLVGVALLVAAAFILVQGGVLAVPLWPAASRAVVALLALIFLVRALAPLRYTGLFKTVRDTPFGRYDTWLYSPLCLLLGLALAHQAVSA
ncbi:DUF3995 domain-containing protein [Aquabacterium sp.]|uniref:DUF3995 domain-containing protein n=1 Tax=Aquabacterium sp. TaxID=1872578 RepID=UPI002BCF3715|nr:DUF3995 domain-containing protein [Aquabacterium sp.]HSW07829.1 DUF3995 domain-containing protein [Aquabacterium sp.]